MLDGLQFLHNLKCLHLDFKHDNILAHQRIDNEEEKKFRAIHKWDARKDSTKIIFSINDLGEGMRQVKILKD